MPQIHLYKVLFGFFASVDSYFYLKNLETMLNNEARDPQFLFHF